MVAGVRRERSELDRIVIFGDSLSDNGGDHGAQAIVRLATASNVEFPGAPYYQGSVFSNGPVYISTVAELLSLPFDDWAVAGATSGALPLTGTLRPPFAGLTQNVTLAIPSALEQAKDYIEAQGGNISANTLYVLDIGGNDLMRIAAGGNATVTDTVAYTGMTLDTLYMAGARSFFVPNSASLDRVPALQPAALGAASQAARAGVHKLVLAYNALLDELVRSFAQTHDGVEIKCWNSYAVFTELLDNAAASCIDTTTPCYTGSANDFFACSRVQNRSVNSDIDPEQHAWWDHCHPTGWMHAKLGEAMAESMGAMVRAV